MAQSTHDARSADVLRVLHVKASVDRQMGGSVTAIAGVARTTVLAGDAATIVTLAGPDDDLSVVARERVDHGIGLVLVRRSRVAPFGFSLRLVRWLWGHIRDYDLVEIHEVYSFPALAAAVVARLRGVPYVVHPHSSLDPYDMRKRARLKRLLRPVVRRVIDSSAGLWFTTDEEARRSDDHGAEVAKVVSPLSVPPPAEPGNRARFRAAYGIAESDFVVLFLGRLDAKKGLPRTIAAFAGADVPGSWLVLAGSGDAAITAEVRQAVRESPARDRILMPGYLPDHAHRDAFAGADLFVLHSDNENFGLAPVEAALAGLPCLLSRDVYVAADLERAGAARVVETTAAALGQVLGDLMGTPEDMRRLTESARAALLPFADRDVARRDRVIRRELTGWLTGTGGAPG